MMQNTEEKLEMSHEIDELLNEIAELKEQVRKHGKAIARIEHWHNRIAFEAREAEWKTLETVLRIFKEEGVR